MDIIHTETDRGNKCVIHNNFTYRKANVLKNGDVVYRCSTEKSCKAGIVEAKYEEKHTKMISHLNLSKPHMIRTIYTYEILCVSCVGSLSI